MTLEELRQIERQSIRDFVQSYDFRGRVLDYGCGDAPYRDLVERTAEWHGWNRARYPGTNAKVNIGEENVLVVTHWNVILCTQVLQYVPFPDQLLRYFRKAASTLVLTYPTNWPEVEREDLHRWTQTGMEFALTEADWKVLHHVRRAEIEPGLALGYGVVCG